MCLRTSTPLDHLPQLAVVRLQRQVSITHFPVQFGNFEINPAHPAILVRQPTTAVVDPVARPNTARNLHQTMAKQKDEQKQTKRVGRTYAKHFQPFKRDSLLCGIVDQKENEEYTEESVIAKIVDE